MRLNNLRNVHDPRHCPSASRVRWFLAFRAVDAERRGARMGPLGWQALDGASEDVRLLVAPRREFASVAASQSVPMRALALRPARRAARGWRDHRR